MAHNSYFQFKQFRVDQNNAAMRVGTDGVLLGAWTEVENATTILDIGTGTGVVALMLAQRSSAQIDAIDIEEGAIKDARHNFEQSPWNSRLNVFHSSLQNFAEKPVKKYDCIVSNPPFFNNSVQSAKKERALARHTDSLSFIDLIESVSKVLHPNGTLNVVLPSEAEKEFRSCANKERLFATRITRIKPNPNKPIKRVLIQFNFEGELMKENELIIETETHHVYTSEAISLLKDFYLQL